MWRHHFPFLIFSLSTILFFPFSPDFRLLLLVFLLSLPTGSSQGATELPSLAIDSIEKEVTEGKASRGDPSDFIETLSDVEERVKRIGLSAAAASPSSFSPRATAEAGAAGAASWVELPTQVYINFLSSPLYSRSCVKCLSCPVRPFFLTRV